MPRRPRILLPDHPLHIVQRGINREPCFFAEEDYQCYLHWLEEAARDCGCAIHAYVLMTNHVHLLLTPTVSGAPVRLMQSLGRRYVQYVNRQYRRTGSLWEGRYKSSVVQEEAYLLACMRYIELNPVRAAMVVDPGGTVGPATAPTGLRKPTRASPRKGSIWALMPTPPGVVRPIAHYSARNSMRRRPVTFTRHCG